MSTAPQGPLDFADLVVVVTGAGRGLGRRYALDLAARGARVVVCARHEETASKVVAEAQADGGEAIACVADARDGQAPVTAALETWRRLDAVVVNAGQTRDRSFGRMSEEEWSDVVGVHLDGARAVTAAAWPTFREQRSGRVVLTGSGAGFFGNRGQANYAAAKAGIVGLGLTLAAEGAPYGIGANVLAPMAMTDMTENVLDEAQGEVLTAERVSPVVLALVHPSCPVSGQVLEAGGGWVGALRWERSAGVRIAGDRPSPEDFAAVWEETLRFDGDSAHPDSIADSVAAGMGAEAR